MKFIPLYILILMFALGLSGCSSSDDSQLSLGCLPANLQANVVAFYPFGNGSLSDASGNGNTLENSSGCVPGPDRDGNPNCAFTFVSSGSQSLTRSDSAFLDNLQNGPFSISMWYKPQEPSVGILVSRGIDFPNEAGFHGEWSLTLGDNSSPRFQMNGHARQMLPPFVVANQWHHIAVAADNGVSTLFLDGVQVEHLEWEYNELSQNIGDFVIGLGYDGSIDDLVIYNKVLSVAEVAQLAQLDACCE